jgi:two-component system, OmpR family, clock-associated histidine kinase SasA
MEALPKPPTGSEASLQLLLFVDKRPNSSERIRQIRNYLKVLKENYSFDLQIVDVGEQPHLAEYFKLVATPSLIKIHPEPRQVLAGSNLVAQLETWWSRWQSSAEEYTASLQTPETSSLEPEPAEPIAEPIRSIGSTGELLQLSDEIFRLKQEKEELQAQLQFKDRLIAMLAHDLRNPLTAVSIALETLEMGNTPKEDGRGSRMTPTLIAQLLKHARTQTKAIDRMITDILQAARSTGAGLRLQPQELDLGELCQDVLQRMKAQFQPKSLNVITDFPSDLPRVHADLEWIGQVMVNLLDNAIKYTPEGGTIRLSILHRTTQKVQVTICDDGPGIPEENQDRIFEEHFRLERDESKDGYGIGLALCRRVIRAHYGQIWVDSSPNQGSCFNFTLPVFRM